MKKNYWTYLVLPILLLLLIVLLNRTSKPDYDKVSPNPYDLGLDSLAQIAPELYCPLDYFVIELNLDSVLAIATDKQGHLLVSGQKQLVILTEEGTEVFRFNTALTATALAVGPENRIYAALENRVLVYNFLGEELNRWPEIHSSAYITSVAAVLNHVFVAEANKGLVYEYSKDGDLIRSFGKEGEKTAADFFSIPSLYFDVAIGPDNSLWVANTGKHKLVNFHPDGRLRSHWGETSHLPHGFCGCCNPGHFVILENGSFITAEKGIVRIKKYNYGGNFIGVLAGPERFGPKATGLDIASGLQDRIFVLEPGRNRIHCFALK